MQEILIPPLIPYYNLNMTDSYKDVFWDEVYSNTSFSNWDFEEGPLLIQDSEIKNAVAHLSDADIPPQSKQIRIQCGMNDREQKTEIFKQKSISASIHK